METFKALEERLFLESEERIEKVGKFKSPNDFPYKRDGSGNPIKMAKRVIPKCSICGQPVKGNLNPEKILTCGYCVLALLGMENDLKIWYRDKLLEAGHPESARSFESFIVEEEDGSEDRGIDLRKKSRPSLGHLKIQPSRTSPQRASVGEHSQKSILPRTDFHDLDSEEWVQGHGCHSTDHDRHLNTIEPTRQTTPQQGTSEDALFHCLSCIGPFCGVLSQNVTYCHKRDWKLKQGSMQHLNLRHGTDTTRGGGEDADKK